MKNEPNFLASKMNLTSAITKDYENERLSRRAKTNPIPPNRTQTPLFHNSKFNIQNSKLKISHSPWSEACPYLIGGRKPLRGITIHQSATFSSLFQTFCCTLYNFLQIFRKFCRFCTFSQLFQKRPPFSAQK